MIHTLNLANAQRVEVCQQPAGCTRLTTIAADGSSITLYLDEISRPWLIRALTIADQDAFLTRTYPYRKGSP